MRPLRTHQRRDTVGEHTGRARRALPGAGKLRAGGGTRKTAPREDRRRPPRLRSAFFRTVLDGTMARSPPPFRPGGAPRARPASPHPLPRHPKKSRFEQRMTLSGHAGPSRESCALPTATSDYSRLSVARSCKAVLRAAQVWYLRVNGWQVVVLCCRGFVVSRDVTLLCATCGARSGGVFAEFLRRGWPTCCGQTMFVTSVSTKTIDDAVRESFRPLSLFVEAVRSSRMPSSRIPRRPV